MFAVGLYVPVHVILLLLVIVDKVPLGAVISLSLEKLATASEKINVTSDVSPILSALSSMVNDETVGAFVSTEIVKELASALVLPAVSEKLFD